MTGGTKKNSGGTFAECLPLYNNRHFPKASAAFPRLQQFAVFFHLRLGFFKN